MEYVTLVNRSSKTLTGTWDGRIYDLKPGKHEFPRIKAEAFKRQNPLMGSEDPYTLHMEYLIGIVEDGDPVDDIEQSGAVESLDRSKLIGGKPTKVVPGGGGLYSRRSPEFSAPASDGSQFSKP